MPKKPIRKGKPSGKELERYRNRWYRSFSVILWASIALEIYALLRLDIGLMAIGLVAMVASHGMMTVIFVDANSKESEE